jgi:hypothetical protein
MDETCRDITFWRAYCDGSMSDVERALAESHLVHCRRCRTQLVSVFDAVSQPVSESVPDHLRSKALGFVPPKARSAFAGPFRRFVPLALAAAIILAFGASLFVLRDRNGNVPTTDIRQSNTTAYQVQLDSPANGAELEPGSLEFRWSDSSAAARYEFTLTDEKGDILFQQRHTITSLPLDTNTLKLSPQRKYYWSVTAILPDGTRRESTVASFTIR